MSLHFNVLGLELTKACQNRCSYCYNSNALIYNLSAQDIDRALEIYYDQLQEDYGIISLLGGEPLIRKKIFLPILKNLNKETKITLNTNALLLDKKNCEDLQSVISKVAVSLDGPMSAHDLNRKTAKNEPTYNKVIQNLPYILDSFQDVFCQATFTPKTISYLSQSYFLAKDLGFKEWYWAPDLYQNQWTEKEFEILEKELNIIAKDYFSHKTMLYKPFENDCQWNSGNLRFKADSHVLLVQANSELKISRLNATCMDYILDQYWFIGNLKSGIQQEKIKEWQEKFPYNADQLYYAYNMKNICEQCLAKAICYNSNHQDKESYLYAIQCIQPRMQCEQKKLITTIKNFYLKNQ